jgi:hypothetical protein
MGDRIEGARIDGQTRISRLKRRLGRFSGEPPADLIGRHSLTKFPLLLIDAHFVWMKPFECL